MEVRSQALLGNRMEKQTRYISEVFHLRSSRTDPTIRARSIALGTPTPTVASTYSSPPVTKKKRPEVPRFRLTLPMRIPPCHCRLFACTRESARQGARTQWPVRGNAHEGHGKPPANLKHGILFVHQTGNRRSGCAMCNASHPGPRRLTVGLIRDRTTSVPHKPSAPYAALSHSLTIILTKLGHPLARRLSHSPALTPGTLSYININPAHHQFSRQPHIPSTLYTHSLHTQSPCPLST